MGTKLFLINRHSNNRFFFFEKVLEQSLFERLNMPRFEQIKSPDYFVTFAWFQYLELFFLVTRNISIFYSYVSLKKSQLISGETNTQCQTFIKALGSLSQFDVEKKIF